MNAMRNVSLRCRMEIMMMSTVNIALRRALLMVAVVVGTHRLHSCALFDGCRLSTLVLSDMTKCSERMEKKIGPKILK